MLKNKYRVAMDAEIDDATVEKIVLFLKNRLEPADFDKMKQLLAGATDTNGPGEKVDWDNVEEAPEEEPESKVLVRKGGDRKARDLKAGHGFGLGASDSAMTGGYDSRFPNRIRSSEF
jgi:hypothetical protein